MGRVLLAAMLAFIAGVLLGRSWMEDEALRQSQAQREAWQKRWQEQERGNAALARQLTDEALRRQSAVLSLERNLEDYRHRFRQRVLLPGAWRLQHDAAARLSAAAQPAAVASDAARPVDDLAALETITGNYAQCQEWRAALIGWQQWHQQLSAPIASP
ncbi:hypothetical protein BUE93_21885 [Chromobacterium amazonense]|uniref:Uncharacterized protein n=2 Tax=Chromobacterium amazonense TaxID=1382803 RepID=A0A2S9WYK5_9NEIS|nr:hypothetical protein BUE93_21885 [Chromobacterium amazonense]